MNNEILEEIKRRGITRLCHFTNSRSFIHIIQKEAGIIANQFLGSEEEVGILKRNDQNRFDDREDYVSCSIEYPNTWYFNSIKNADMHYKDWVILFIDPTIMAQKETLFSPVNAATGGGKYLKEGILGFSELFKERVVGKYDISRTEQMLNCCPTDGQAEVMIYKNIPRKYIKGICVPTLEQAAIERIKISHLDIDEDFLDQIDWVVSEDLFDNSWNKMIREGKRPIEQIVPSAELKI